MNKDSSNFIVSAKRFVDSFRVMWDVVFLLLRDVPESNAHLVGHLYMALFLPPRGGLRHSPASHENLRMPK